ncbi:MAG: magnesium and cobalt transport protein CorA [Actinomycetales bacterium]|nr:magnesium and cobalt transport protein CorA [Actinomycetales bacterium]
MIGGIGLYDPTGCIDVGTAAEWDALPPQQRLDRLSELLRRASADADAFTWVGLYEPTHEEFAVVQGAFDLPSLFVEDALNSSHRPEIELDDDGHGLAVLKVLDYVEASSDVLTGQVGIFLGPHYVVTVRFGDTRDLSALRRRLAEDGPLRALGPIGVLYLLLDDVVDGYLHVAQEVGTDVEQLEAAVFQQDAQQTSADRIYRLKREALEVRRAVNPLLADAQAFVVDTCRWVPGALHPNFRDVGEHLLRANDITESVDSLLMTMLMASMALQDLQQNRDMRKISAWVALAAVPTMVAGIYGMNFDNMPELRQDWGYPVVLAGLVIACGLLYRGFKRSGWL